MSYFGMDSSFFSGFFGNTNTSMFASSSFSLGDYAMIKSGSYKKLLRQYYEENGNKKEKSSSTIKSSAEADSTANLMSIKDSAEKVKNKAEELSKIDLAKADRGEVAKKVSSFVESYNAVLDATENIESVSILQSAIWMKDRVAKSEGLLSKVGITIGEGNELKLDEETFKKAGMSDLTTVLSGRNSVLSSVAQRASQIYNIAGTQAILNNRTSSYTKNGSYNTVTSKRLLDSLM